jgi:hypothetical protein
MSNFFISKPGALLLVIKLELMQLICNKTTARGAPNSKRTEKSKVKVTSSKTPDKSQWSVLMEKKRAIKWGKYVARFRDTLGQLQPTTQAQVLQLYWDCINDHL